MNCFFESGTYFGWIQYFIGSIVQRLLFRSDLRTSSLCSNSIAAPYLIHHIINLIFLLQPESIEVLLLPWFHFKQPSLHVCPSFRSSFSYGVSIKLDGVRSLTWRRIYHPPWWCVYHPLWWHAHQQTWWRTDQQLWFDFVWFLAILAALNLSKWSWASQDNTFFPWGVSIRAFNCRSSMKAESSEIRGLSRYCAFDMGSHITLPAFSPNWRQIVKPLEA